LNGKQTLYSDYIQCFSDRIRKASARGVRPLAWLVRVSLHEQHHLEGKREQIVEITKALAALKPLYGKDNVEIVTADGTRVRGIVRSMKTTQALTKPSVKIERADGEIVKIVFSDIIKVIDHNAAVNGSQ
jgi:hypothetical protein